MNNRNLYEEWKILEENNRIIEIVLGNYLGADKHDIETTRCADGNIYYYGDFNITGKSGYYPVLPDNFIIYGDVNLNKCKLRKLPSGFIVHGDLMCMHNNIKEIPSDLKVYGDFDCSYNKIKELPTTIFIKEILFCIDNKLKFIPSNLNVGKQIYCGRNDFKTTNTIHHSEIYVDNEHQQLQKRIMKLNKLLGKC